MPCCGCSILHGPHLTQAHAPIPVRLGISLGLRFHPNSRMTHPGPLGIFDSGIGGLSIARRTRALLPNANLLYVADSIHAPYGEKSEHYIQQRSDAITRFLMENEAKAIVVACNTATVVAVASLRAEFDIPIVAMEPAIKPAALMTRSGAVGVLATERTLASEQFQDLVQRYANGVRIVAQPCPGLVELVERGHLDPARTMPLLSRYLQPLLDEHIDVLVLGCTHYPFLLPTISHMTGSGVTIIDPAVAVTQQLRRRLASDAGMAPHSGAGVLRFFPSGVPDVVGPVIELLWQAPVQLRQVLAPHHA